MGQVAVGAVVMNRVEHPSFPNDIAGVIYQPGAFSCLQDGQWDEPVADSAYRAAREALAGGRPDGRRDLLLQPADGHQRVDLVAAGDPDHRQPPVLRLSARQGDEPLRREQQLRGCRPRR